MEFANFKGLRNNVSWERQEMGDLSAADNVYLDDTGRVARRDGVTELVAGAAHSIWAEDDICLYVQGTTLYRFLPDDTSETIRTDMSGEPVAYHKSAGTVYYSDGIVSGAYSEFHGSMSWGVQEPDTLSTSIVAGNLPAGRYGYTATHSDALGRESGAVGFGMVELTEQGGIEFALPEWADPLAINIYVTHADGDTYYLLTTLESGTAAVHNSQKNLYLPLNTAFKSQPPEGSIVSSYRGHLLIADGSWVFYSEPYAYHLFDKRSYLPFEDEVAIVAPVADGIFVATREKTYFLAGTSPKELQLRTVAEHGAIKGSLTYCESTDIGGLERVPSQPLAIWSSEAGICAGGNEGLFINLTESRYKFDEVNDRGASVLLDMGGSKQFITSIL